MSVRLVLDEMFHPRIATELIARGHDVVAVVASADLRGSSDADLVAWARGEQRAVVTNNVVDFERLRRRNGEGGAEMPTLIYTSDAAFPRDRRLLGRMIAALDRVCSDETMVPTGRVLWLQRVPR